MSHADFDHVAQSNEAKQLARTHLAKYVETMNDELEADAFAAARFLGDDGGYNVHLTVTPRLVMMVIAMHRSLYGFDIGSIEEVVDEDLRALYPLPQQRES